MKSATKKSRKAKAPITRRGAKSRVTSKEPKPMFDKPTTAEKAKAEKTETLMRADEPKKVEAVKVVEPVKATVPAKVRPTGLVDPVVDHRTAVEWLCLDLPLHCTVLTESGEGENARVEATFTTSFPSKFMLRGRLNRDADYLVDIRRAT